MHLLSNSALLLFALLIAGCNPALTESGPNDSSDDSRDEVADRVLELSEQNAELIQMLEEAEDKVARTQDELESSQAEIEHQSDRIKTLESQRDNAVERLGRANSLVDAIRMKLNEFASETSGQLESLEALLPASDPSSEVDQQLLAPTDSDRNEEPSGG